MVLRLYFRFIVFCFIASYLTLSVNPNPSARSHYLPPSGGRPGSTDTLRAMPYLQNGERRCNQSELRNTADVSFPRHASLTKLSRPKHALVGPPVQPGISLFAVRNYLSMDGFGIIEDAQGGDARGSFLPRPACLFAVNIANQLLLSSQKKKIPSPIWSFLFGSMIRAMGLASQIPDPRQYRAPSDASQRRPCFSIPSPVTVSGIRSRTRCGLCRSNPD